MVPKVGCGSPSDRGGGSNPTFKKPRPDFPPRPCDIITACAVDDAYRGTQPHNKPPCYCSATCTNQHDRTRKRKEQERLWLSVEHRSENWGERSGDTMQIFMDLQSRCYFFWINDLRLNQEVHNGLDPWSLWRLEIVYFSHSSRPVKEAVNNNCVQPVL